MSIIGLDVGDKKIGVAVSYSNIEARPLKTLARQDWAGLGQILRHIQPSRLIVGVPKNRAGQATSQTQNTLGYLKELKDYLRQEKFEIKIMRVDERLSSFAAAEILKKAGQGQSQRKKNQIHAVSAQVILDQYLEGLNVNT